MKLHFFLIAFFWVAQLPFVHATPANCVSTLKLITPDESFHGRNAQQEIFQLRESGKMEAAQALEDKISRLLIGPYLNAKSMGIGAGGGSYYFFESGIVGIGKKMGRHWGSNVEAEVAAFKIDRLYDLNLVPVTVSRDETGGSLSMQLFYGEAKEARAQGLIEIVETDQKKMQIFDYLIQNFDRKGSNYLVTDKGRIIAIDHGVSLHNARSNPYSPRAPDLKDLDFNFFKTTQGRRVLNKLKTTPDQKIKEALTGLSKEKFIQDFIDRKNDLLKAFEEYSFSD